MLPKLDRKKIERESEFLGCLPGSVGCKHILNHLIFLIKVFAESKHALSGAPTFNFPI